MGQIRRYPKAIPSASCPELWDLAARADAHYSPPAISLTVLFEGISGYTS